MDDARRANAAFVDFGADAWEGCVGRDFLVTAAAAVIGSDYEESVVARAESPLAGFYRLIRVTQFAGSELFCPNPKAPSLK